MPNNPRRRQAGQSSTGDILREIFGSVFDFVGERVQEAAPRCALCDEIAIPLRCPCGNFACKSHGYFNFSLGRAICPICAMNVGAEVEPGDDEDEEPYDDSPRQAEEAARAKRARAQARARKRHHQQHGPGPSPEAVSIAWETLGLDPDIATENDVNKAFRQAARDCHPDLHPGDAVAERRFKGLRRATELCLEDIAARGKG